MPSKSNGKPQIIESMLSGYHALTISHKQVSVEKVGGLVLPVGESRFSQLHALKNTMGWDELLYLSTCNRVLFFFYSNKNVDKSEIEKLLNWFSNNTEAEVTDLSDYLQRYNAGNAIRHLFDVASSMDSMVLGEREILRQLREAYTGCKREKLTGDHLRLAMDAAVKCAKKVYTDTALGEKAVSVVSLAYKTLEKANLPQDARICLIGAGQTNQLFAKFLKKAGFWNVWVFNRTISKAEKLAEELLPQSISPTKRAFSTEDLGKIRQDFDVLITCTSATEPLVRLDNYADIVQSSESHKLLIDLAIPADIDPALPTRFPVQLVGVEQLRALAENNIAFRRKAMDSAAEIIGNLVLAFRSTWHQRQVERAMRPIPEGINEAKQTALNIVFAKELAEMDDSTKETVLKMLTYMEKKAVAISMKTMIEISKELDKHLQQPSTPIAVLASGE